MLDNETTKKFCLELIEADTEEEVENIIKNYGFWDNPTAWRPLGDIEGNFSIAGVQQSDSGAALAEKLVNAIDARLIGACYQNGMKPEQVGVPQSIRQAVAQFIEKSPRPESERTGRIFYWDRELRKNIADTITVAVTGSTRRPCYTIVDAGEGQTPDQVPNTFMSLIRGNKQKIPFVHGMFCMGGTGVLRFSGEKSFQLIVTKRDPEVIKKCGNGSERDHHWSVTIVRKDNARDNEKNSIFRYLAPINSDSRPGNGEVLSFESDKLMIFPDKGKPYAKEANYGSLVKVYEYYAKGFNQKGFRKDSLLQKMNLLLPDPALPIRFHECRSDKGHQGSNDTTFTGIRVRLDDDKAENIETSLTCPFSIDGYTLSAHIYVFKKGKSKTYKKSQGILFVYNGQTHSTYDKAFFKRDKVKLSYIADSIIVLLNCDNLPKSYHEKLFMNSRDRMSKDSEVREKIDKALEYMLRENEALRELANKRKQEDLSETLVDNKPLADTLKSIIKNHNNLWRIFMQGQRISTPFRDKSVQTQDKEFKGLKFPTYFRFKGKKDGYIKEINAPINQRRRIKFDTNANNDYFERFDDPGEVEINIIKENTLMPVTDFVGPNLSNGLATLSFDLPKDSKVGDKLECEIKVSDISRTEPFVNHCVIKIEKEAESNGKQTPKKQKSPSGQEGQERSVEGGIALPKIKEVKKGDSKWDELEFEDDTGLKLKVGTEEGEYIFFVNVDNKYLQHELSQAKGNEQLIKHQFIYGLVLSALGVIHDSTNQIQKIDEDKEEKKQEDLEETVEKVCRSLSLFILPMIKSLGELQPDDTITSNDILEEAIA